MGVLSFRIVRVASFFLFLALMSTVLRGEGLPLESGLTHHWPLRSHLADLMTGDVAFVQGQRALRMDSLSWRASTASPGCLLETKVPVDFTTPFTISFWMEPSIRALGAQTLLAGDSSWELFYHRTSVSKGVLGFQADGLKLIAIPMTAASEAHHVVLIGDGVGMAVYVDQDHAYSVARVPLLPVETLAVTFMRNEADRLMVRDLTLWDRALTEDAFFPLAQDPERPLMRHLGDLDDDGLPDFWERRHGFDPRRAEPRSDPDGDGLSNAEEFHLATDPNLADTDGDGLTDKAEDRRGIWLDSEHTGTDPLIGDSDGDGVADGQEVAVDRDPNIDESIVSEPRNAWGDELLAYWPFDGSTEERVRGFHGAMRGTVLAKFRHGRFGKGLHLTGKGTSFAIGEEGSGLASQIKDHSFTISAWFMLERDSALRPVLLSHGGERPWWIGVGEYGEMRFWVSPYQAAPAFDLWEETYSQGRVRDGYWHHVVAMADASGSVRKLVVDGQAMSIDRDAGRLSGEAHDHLVFGHAPADAASVSSYWKGVVDDVALWRRELTENEMDRLWDRGVGSSLGEVLGLNSKDRLDPFEDLDGDGLTNEVESRWGTDPTHADTDGDQLADGEELEMGTDPRHPDTDRDGWTDGGEMGRSNPLWADTDADGLLDPLDPEPTWRDIGLDLDEEMKAYWTFDGDHVSMIGKTRVSVSGREPIQYLPWREGKGVRLNGDDQFVVMALPEFSFSDQSFAIALWFQAEGSTHPRTLLSGKQWSLTQRPAGDGLALEIASSRPAEHPAEVRFFPGKGPQHLCLVVDGHSQIATLYLDGERVATQGNFFIADDDSPGPDMALGAALQGTVFRNWMGMVDDLAVWGRTLTAKEVRMLAESEDDLHEVLAIVEDVDGDGLEDRFEYFYTNDDLTLLTLDGDYDRDGVTDGEEIRIGTNPLTGSTLIAHVPFDEADPLFFQNAINPMAPGRFYVAKDQALLLQEPPLASGYSVAVNHERWRQRSYGALMLPPLRTFTISVWLRQHEQIADPAILFTRQGTVIESPPFIVAITKNAVEWRTNEASIELTSGPVLQVGQPHHLVIVYRDGQEAPGVERRVSIYVDGHEVASRTDGLAPWVDLGNSAFLIGGMAFGSGFLGHLDDLQIYADALSAETIHALYHLPGTTAFSPAPFTAPLLGLTLVREEMAYRLHWRGASDGLYDVLVSDTLAGPWRVQGPPEQRVQGEWHWRDPILESVDDDGQIGPIHLPQRFYRVRSVR